MMIQLEQKSVIDFHRKYTNGDFGSQRKGQALYGYFKLDRVISLREGMDKIYNAPNNNFSAVFAEYIEMI